MRKNRSPAAPATFRTIPAAMLLGLLLLLVVGIGAAFPRLRPLWKPLRYRLEWLLCLSAARLVPRLPRRWCRRAGLLAGSVWFRFDPEGRAVALANLGAAFGPEMPLRRRVEVARKSFQNFACAMLDLFWATRLTPENHQQFMDVRNAGQIRQWHEENRGSIYVVPHFGNFEWLSLSFGFHGYHTYIVTEELKNPLLNDLLDGQRQLSGHTVIPQEWAMLRLLKKVKRGGMAAALVDLTINPDQSAVVIECFGMKKPVSFIHALLHRRTGIPLTLVTSYPNGDGTWHAYSEAPIHPPPEASDQELTQLCWDACERIIRQHPHLWLWSYKHWRYRPEEDGEKYPFYANRSSKFDKLLKKDAAVAKG